ncbi:hypothetical protein SELMODRAFT_427914 [Selaginella moellendorffii]|uniref:Metallo-beta-lactamase domain-containing protein n=1 Tax=Selaginella moellendorffii TaxID=88036 RepID=D8T140_SELML|nr:hypothetical protein SELMODRAFT_427914 [Selaginella moellendorffii]
MCMQTANGAKLTFDAGKFTLRCGITVVRRKHMHKQLNCLQSPADETIGRNSASRLLAGRDFCLNPGNIIETQIFNAGAQMQNYVYLVGDAKTREAVVVDPAWDVKGIKAFADAEHIKLVGAVATHYHFDHTGGPPPPPFDRLMIKLPGVRQLAVEDNLPIYVNKHDAGTIKTKNEVPGQSIVELDDLSTVVGSLKLEFTQHTGSHSEKPVHSYQPEHLLEEEQAQWIINHNQHANSYSNVVESHVVNILGISLSGVKIYSHSQPSSILILYGRHAQVI